MLGVRERSVSAAGRNSVPPPHRITPASGRHGFFYLFNLFGLKNKIRREFPSLDGVQVSFFKGKRGLFG